MGASLAATSSPIYTPSQPLVGSVARRPIAIVKLDGVAIAWLAARTTNVSHNAADTFEVDLPLQGQAATANWAAWGSPNTQSEIEILYGLLDASGNPTGLTSAVVGPVDHVEVSQPENRVRLTGRDYSQRLIDTQTFDNFTNQTASQIATMIAGNHGLTPVVAATSTPVGAADLDSNAHTMVTRRQSEWDLLTTLAKNEGYVVYVRGRSLYFQPDTEPTGAPYALVWRPPASPGASPGGPFKKLTVSRNITLARGIQVVVLSHDRDDATTVSATATATLPGGGTGNAATSPQQYTVEAPGLTQDQCMARAAQLIKGYAQFERIIEIEGPGDPTLSFEQPIQLSGTGTDWDQIYFADRIERSISMEAGFGMHLRAKNKSTSASITVVAGSPDD